MILGLDCIALSDTNGKNTKVGLNNKTANKLNNQYAINIMFSNTAYHPNCSREYSLSDSGSSSKGFRSQACEKIAEGLPENAHI